MMSRIEERKGKVLQSYGEVKIIEGFPYNYYQVVQPTFAEKEQKISDALKRIMMGRIHFQEAAKDFENTKKIKQFFQKFEESIAHVTSISDLQKKIADPSIFNSFKLDLVGLLKEYFPSVKNRAALANDVFDNTIGYGLIAPMIRDPYLEEIMINGSKTYVFVFHTRYGMCKSNLYLEDTKYINKLIEKIAFTVGKKFSENHPLLDARLLDGSRANATYSMVTPFGNTLTIRKFTRIPLSIANLISTRTLSAEAAAFLWVAVEGFNIEPMNIIIVGGAGSGKTTTLNVLSKFVRYRERIVTIEDTLELHLGDRENWIQMESQPKTLEHEEVTMDALLRNSIRMRPDRMLVGEVRGPEAQTLFVAMDLGHKGCMGTLHSNTAREMILRLTASPMSVPMLMIPLLDLIVVQYKMVGKDSGAARRVAQIAEVSGLEGKPLLSNVYEWDRKDDTLKRTKTPSHTLEVLAEKTGRTKNEVVQEINVRKLILEWMIKKGITSSSEVETLIQQYYSNPKKILERVAAETPTEPDEPQIT